MCQVQHLMLVTLLAGCQALCADDPGHADHACQHVAHAA